MFSHVPLLSLHQENMSQGVEWGHIFFLQLHSFQVALNVIYQWKKRTWEGFPHSFTPSSMLAAITKYPNEEMKQRWRWINIKCSWTHLWEGLGKSQDNWENEILCLPTDTTKSHHVLSNPEYLHLEITQYSYLRVNTDVIVSLMLKC